MSEQPTPGKLGSVFEFPKYYCDLTIVIQLPLPAILLKSQNRLAARQMDAGSVSTHAKARLRTVLICIPEWFAAMVPATPDDKTCVVLTGKPNQSAAPMVAIAVISAAAPCA